MCTRERHDGVSDTDIENASTIWNYMKMNHTCRKCDVMLCLGTNDIRIAERAASLWLQGMADVILFTGNVGTLTKGLWSRPEAEVFRDRALEMGVSRDKILMEPEARNTGENVRFAYKVLSDNNIKPRSVLLIQKPFMERRTYATFMKQWPGDVDIIDVVVTSPELDMVDYPSETIGDLAEMITVMVGDLARIKLYEELGFQISQDIPGNVQTAYNQLLKTGRYSRHLPEAEAK